jgi:hypothetical protein
MKVLHTKGEWKVINDTDGCRIYSDMFGGIANIPHNGKHKDEHEANAKLISASPDLLEALQPLVNICKFVPKEVFTEEGRRDFQALLNNAQAAINKAIQ